MHWHQTLTEMWLKQHQHADVDDNKLGEAGTLHMTRKLLVANRGEIAVRAFRAAVELDIATVAVFTWADRNSLHRTKADESYQIGDGDSPLRPYLDLDTLIAAAVDAGADAIYPPRHRSGGDVTIEVVRCDVKLSTVEPHRIRGCQSSVVCHGWSQETSSEACRAQNASSSAAASSYNSDVVTRASSANMSDGGKVRFFEMLDRIVVRGHGCSSGGVVTAGSMVNK